MIQFFESIADFIAVAWKMVVNFFSSLLTAFSIVEEAITLPVQLTAYVPRFIGSCIICVFAIGIIKLFLGWGNS